ncbi:hypothetical protein [Aeromonas veronii]
MASDHRVSFISNTQPGKITHWQDFPRYRKSFCYQDVLYGFAGANNVLRLFLQYMKKQPEQERIGFDVRLLDDLAALAGANKVDFMMMRYQGTLQVFGYLTQGAGTLYNSSSGQLLTVEQHGIGSGARSTAYAQKKGSPCPTEPIKAIIKSNEDALKKLERETRKKKLEIKSISIDDKMLVCTAAGGDPLTGGGCVMTKRISQNNVFDEQIAVLDSIDGIAASYNSFAFCSLDPAKEKENLDRLGFKPGHSVKPSQDDKDFDMYQRLSDDFSQLLSSRRTTTESKKKLNV